MHYRIEVADLHAHLYGVTLTIAQPAANQRVSLPVWIAGSYMVREFAKQITGISARQGKRHVAVQQLDKATWVVDCEAGKPLTLHYQVHAHDDSVRTARLRLNRPTPWIATQSTTIKAEIRNSVARWIINRAAVR